MAIHGSWQVLVLAQPSPPSGIYLEDLSGFGSSPIGTMATTTNWGTTRARRQMYGYTDILSNGNVECIYTGFQQPGGFVTYPNPINAEHIVPQSFFGSSLNPCAATFTFCVLVTAAPTARAATIPYGEVNDNQAQWYGVNGNSYTSTSNEPARQRQLV